VSLRQGRTEVSLRIESLHLNPGTYAVALWLSRAAGPPLDYIESAFELEVVRARESGFGLSPTADGLVPCDFQVTVA